MTENTAHFPSGLATGAPTRFISHTSSCVMACLVCVAATGDAGLVSAAWTVVASEAQAAAISREPRERRRRGKVMGVVREVKKSTAGNIIAHRFLHCQG